MTYTKGENKFFSWCYDKPTDSFYVFFKRGLGHKKIDTQEMACDVIVDFDKENNILGVEVLNFKNPRRKKIKSGR